MFLSVFNLCNWRVITNRIIWIIKLLMYFFLVLEKKIPIGMRMQRVNWELIVVGSKEGQGGWLKGGECNKSRYWFGKTGQPQVESIENTEKERFVSICARARVCVCVWELEESRTVTLCHHSTIVSYNLKKKLSSFH